MSVRINATEFKAKCLDILDRVGRGEIDSVEVTKRGKTVARVVAPLPSRTEASQIFGSLRGSVVIPDGFDLTSPVFDEELDARKGVIHR